MATERIAVDDEPIYCAVDGALIGADLLCPACGVEHGDPCAACGQRGYHDASCPALDGLPDDTPYVQRQEPVEQPESTESHYEHAARIRALLNRVYERAAVGHNLRRGWHETSLTARDVELIHRRINEAIAEEFGKAVLASGRVR